VAENSSRPIDRNRNCRFSVFFLLNPISAPFKQRLASKAKARVPLL